MPMVDLKAQYQALKSGIDKRIQKVLDHGQFILGPEVYELEEQLADYVGVSHAITCANGTDALQLSLMALNIKPGDAVFCPTFTFVATAEAISLVGATPVFVDSDPDTFNICPIDLEKRIESTIRDKQLEPKVVIAVDLFGLPANYPALTQIAKQYNLKLVEDAAQGFGGEILGKRAGSFGDIATTSFFPAKPLGCYGDGGAIFTNDDQYAEIIRSLRVHGKGENKYDNIRVGMNSRLDTIQAAILLEKLNAFPEELSIRNSIADCYYKSLSAEIKSPYVPENFTSSWAQFSLLHPQRNDMIVSLRTQDVMCYSYYIKGIHQQKAYEEYVNGEYKIAEMLSECILSIPIYPYMERDEIDRVVEILNAL
ncbi:MAG: aminotransferase DegT [Gammaproteobacteria bacterium]|nr:MAG: aminotransferase DegT [Gammaproteobacteria bacterium]